MLLMKNENLCLYMTLLLVFKYIFLDILGHFIESQHIGHAGVLSPSERMGVVGFCRHEQVCL